MNSLCCPELMPQMVGGLTPDGLVMVKKSVAHNPVAEGLAITKLSKSSLTIN